VTWLQDSKAATTPQEDLGAGAPLMMEASGSGNSEPAAPSEGGTTAVVGAADDAVAKEVAVKKRDMDANAAEKVAAVEAVAKKAIADRAATVRPLQTRSLLARLQQTWPWWTEL
jgi:hypothetical protein